MLVPLPLRSGTGTVNGSGDFWFGISASVLYSNASYSQV